MCCICLSYVLHLINLFIVVKPCNKDMTLDNYTKNVKDNKRYRVKIYNMRKIEKNRIYRR